MDASHVDSIVDRIRSVRIVSSFVTALLIATLPLAGWTPSACAPAVTYLLLAPFLWHALSARWRVAISSYELTLTPLFLAACALPWVWSAGGLVALAVARVSLQGVSWRFLAVAAGVAAVIGVAAVVRPTMTPPAWVFATVAVWLLGVACMVAWLSYRQTMLLNDARKAALQSREALADVARRLAKYLSPQLHAALFAAPRTERAPHRCWLTVFFCDLCGFTRLSDSLEPEQLAGLLNEYFQQITEIALKHGATVDKFLGDGVMVFFGDPESRGRVDDARACAAMANEIRAWMRGWSRQWEAQGYDALSVRMGIASGICTAGDFGANHRLDYTVIGRAANLASRLESLAPENGVWMCARTAALLPPQATHALGPMQVRGLLEPLPVYELCEEEDPTRARAHSSLLVDE